MRMTLLLWLAGGGLSPGALEALWQDVLILGASLIVAVLARRIFRFLAYRQFDPDGLSASPAKNDGAKTPFPLRDSAAHALAAWHGFLILALAVAIWWLWPRIVPAGALTEQPAPYFAATDFKNGGQDFANVVTPTSTDPFYKALYSRLRPDTQNLSKTVASAAGSKPPADAKAAEAAKEKLSTALAADLSTLLLDRKLGQLNSPGAASVLASTPALDAALVPFQNWRLLKVKLANVLNAEAVNAPERAGNDVLLQSSAQREQDYLLLVLLFGALGSCVFAAGSSSARVGLQEMDRHWLSWYLVRPLIGMTLAGIFYCVIRGGLVTPRAQSADINVYVVAAAAGLVGLFAKAATDRLRTVFDNFAAPEKAGEHPPATAIAPEISGFKPDPVPTADAGKPIQVSGKNFAQGAQITIGDQRIDTTGSGGTELTFILPESLRHPATLQVTLVNPNKQASRAKPLTIITPGGESSKGKESEKPPTQK